MPEGAPSQLSRTPSRADAQSSTIERLRHTHDHGSSVSAHERKTRWVVALTFAMMVIELFVGYATGSLALAADGWHMATHAGALGMAALAYRFARTNARSREFSFGTGKVHALAGYTSAVVLALIALLMIAESLRRFVQPEAIAFSEALPVAVLGLAVNLVSVKLLHTEDHHHRDEQDHHHDDHHHDHHHHHPMDTSAHDHNLRAAYLHVLADALTSVLAILALVGGRYFGWAFLDAAMGIVGGVVIARWSYGLCQQAARQLLDVVPSEALAERVRASIESRFAGTHVVDLHLWEIGPRARACIVSVATASPLPPTMYHEAIASAARLDHVTVEVHPLPPVATASGRMT